MLFIRLGTLCKKSPYWESFWSAFSSFFPHSHWIRRDTRYLSVFSSNAGKCGKNADQNNSQYGHFLPSGRQKRNVIYYKFTKLLPIGIFKSNGSLSNFYPTLPNTFFVHKMDKNEVHTWNEDLVNTRNEYLQSIIL